MIATNPCSIPLLYIPYMRACGICCLMIIYTLLRYRAECTTSGTVVHGARGGAPRGLDPAAKPGRGRRSRRREPRTAAAGRAGSNQILGLGLLLASSDLSGAQGLLKSALARFRAGASSKSAQVRAGEDAGRGELQAHSNPRRRQCGSGQAGKLAQVHVGENAARDKLKACSSLCPRECESEWAQRLAQVCVSEN